MSGGVGVRRSTLVSATAPRACARLELETGRRRRATRCSPSAPPQGPIVTFGTAPTRRADDARATNAVAARCHTNTLKRRRARGLGARDAGISPERRHHELVVGGEVLRPRRARDGEDRLQINSRRAAAARVVARKQQAQERAAQGLGAELVHGCRPFLWVSAVAGARAPNPGRFAPRLRRSGKRRRGSPWESEMAAMRARGGRPGSLWPTNPE